MNISGIRLPRLWRTSTLMLEATRFLSTSSQAHRRKEPLIMLKPIKTLHGRQEHFERGPTRSSTWWPPAPISGRRVLRMYPVRARKQLRIVLVREGCVNRMFFTFQIKSNLAETKEQGIEQIGSWDPLPNKEHGEQLIGLNFARLMYWLGRGAKPSDRVAEMFGLMGLFPVHPRSYLAAHRTSIVLAARMKMLETGQLEAVHEEAEGKGVEEEANFAYSKQESVESKMRRQDAVFRRGKERENWWRVGIS